MHGILWSKCNVPSCHHVLCMMLKGILVDIYMLHKWNPKFECLDVFLKKIQTKFAGHGVNIISHVTVHPDCAKFEFIRTIYGRCVLTNVREVANCGPGLLMCIYMIDSHTVPSTLRVSWYIKFVYSRLLFSWNNN